MPPRDTYHAIVRAALEQDGWTIRHDPYAFERILNIRDGREMAEGMQVRLLVFRPDEGVIVQWIN